MKTIKILILLTLALAAGTMLRAEPQAGEIFKEYKYNQGRQWRQTPVSYLDGLPSTYINMDIDLKDASRAGAKAPTRSAPVPATPSSPERGPPPLTARPSSPIAATSLTSAATEPSSLSPSTLDEPPSTEDLPYSSLSAGGRVRCA